MIESLELLAPCKTADIGIEAIRHGADAVYIGGPLFSARAGAGNSIADIERLTSYAHRFNARVYMALNTIFTDEELPHAVRLAHEAHAAGVDALILQDMGLLECDLPPVQLHASTQCDIRTPEKAAFLEKVGFSQIVPARELTLNEIRSMKAALTHARIEFFIHGALCVSYSGQCYASQVLKGRSANRGDCAQICRLPFDVYREDGTPLKKAGHVLSLKDNNQSEHLSELIEAGVRSFKIEGRYKDLSYVKNTVAFYRKKLDAFLELHAGRFIRASDGTETFSFAPSPESAFNRGSTDYFTCGRAEKMAAMDSPKNTGAYIGLVTEIRPDSFTVKTKEELHNGDGLTFFTDTEELSGLLINRAEQTAPHLWRVFTREPVSRIRGLEVGTRLMRNKDAAWLKKMMSETALRKIPIRIEAKVSPDRIELKARDAGGCEASSALEGAFDAAKDAAKAKEQLARSLSKLGATDFSLENLEIMPEGSAPFVSASALNELRRELTEKLAGARSEKRAVLPKAPQDTSVPFSLEADDYHANVLNQKARDFYARHGVQITSQALESQGSKGGIPKDYSGREVEVMRCRYCIRDALDLCPKKAKARGEKIKPEPLILKSGKTTLTANFHCKPCEMSVTVRA